MIIISNNHVIVTHKFILFLKAFDWYIKSIYNLVTVIKSNRRRMQFCFHIGKNNMNG